MKNFKALHPKSYYKSEDSWLRAVYRNNKEIIDAEYQDIGKPFQIFKSQVKEYKQQGLTAAQGVKTIARSTQFTSELERFHENFYSGLKAFRGEYKLFREMTKEHGRYTKFEADKLVWDKNAKGYVYDGKVKITYVNSPYGINITRI